MRLGNDVSGDDAARPVFDDHLLAQRAGKALRDQARLHIVAAAGFGRDDAYGLVRIILAGSRLRRVMQHTAMIRTSETLQLHKLLLSAHGYTGSGLRLSSLTTSAATLARLVAAFFVGLARGRILLVDEHRRVLRAQRLTLRFRERHERLVHQHHGGYAYFPGCKCVAHGGAGAGPSGADTDDEIVDRVGDLA